MKISILYEDNHLLIVEKPVNIPVQADKSGDRDLLTILKEDLKVRYDKPGNVFLGLVHRLDRPVGGVMVFAKTSKAASRLSNEMRKQTVERGYMAVIHGKPWRKKARLTDYLWKDHRKNIVHVVRENYRGAKKAVLDYEVLRVMEDFSLVSVTLQTGRPHQIRVQLAEMGTPIVGDQKYGRQHRQPGQQIALWANFLSVKHPTKDEFVTIECPPPAEYPWN